jgi:hypothetical protein
MKQKNVHILIAAGLILMAAGARIVNQEMHLYNFAPLAALGVFSGAVIKDKKYAFLVPVLGQLIADAYFQFFTNIPGFYPGEIFNYTALVAATGLGMFMGQPKALKILGFTLGGSVIFFLLSNLGMWATGYYGYTFGGLVKTYVAGLPFFKNTLIGDMAGSVLMFGLYFLLQRALEAKAQKATA